MNPRFTFSGFVVGKGTQFAVAAARAVAGNPGLTFNPLFLGGGTGLGKTHLLHAIGHHLHVARPDLDVVYTCAPAFAEDFARYAQAGQLPAFRARYDTADVLLFDDIHALATGPAGPNGGAYGWGRLAVQSVQDELCRLFDVLHQAKKHLVLAGTQPPQALGGLDERLRSRLQMGLVADLEPPDLECRLAILRSKAEAQPVALPAAALEILARRVQGDVRELEGALTCAVAAAGLARLPLTVESVAAAVPSGFGRAPTARVTPDHVLRAVCRYFGISPEALRGKQRDKETVLPRQVAMYLMRGDTGVSLADIGACLGGRDHSTVLHGYDKVARQLPLDSRLRDQVAAVRQLLDGTPLGAPEAPGGGRGLGPPGADQPGDHEAPEAPRGGRALDSREHPTDDVRGFANTPGRKGTIR